jgi:hypothetical protein
VPLGLSPMLEDRGPLSTASATRSLHQDVKPGGGCLRKSRTYVLEVPGPL